MRVRVGFRCLCLAGALSVGLGLPSAARAQSSSGDKAAAEALFDDGLKLLRARQYADAVRKLETSQRIDPAVGTLLYLGECYEQLGRSASAWATFREAGSLAQASGQADRAKLAAQRAARLEPELAYLAVGVTAEANVPGLVVTRAGETVTAGLYGVSVPADPGDVVVEAVAPGHARYSIHVALAARDKKAVAIPALVALPKPEGAPVASAPVTSSVPVAPIAPPPAVDAPVASPPRPSRVIPYVLGGAGLVGIGVGSFFGLRALDRNRQAEQVCSGNSCTTQAGVDLTDQARSAATVSNVAFIAGGALLASAVVTFVLLSPKKTDSVAWSLTPELGRQHMGLTLARTVE